MTATEQNRAIAIQFITTMKDFGGADERLLTSDVKWILPNQTVWTLEMIKAHVANRRTGLMPELPEMIVVATTADGDRVALEAAGKCKLANGKRYDNFYHFALLFRDGRICALKEYCDTKLAAEAFAGG